MTQQRSQDFYNNIQDEMSQLQAEYMDKMTDIQKRYMTAAEIAAASAIKSATKSSAVDAPAEEGQAVESTAAEAPAAPRPTSDDTKQLEKHVTELASLVMALAQKMTVVEKRLKIKE